MSLASLEIGFALDRLYRSLEGHMDGSKRPTLAQLASILAAAGTRYAVIGGVALQVHRREPRTTLDIDVVVADRALWPRTALIDAGFRLTGTFEHSENWSGPDGTPVQVTDDATLAAAIDRSVSLDLDGAPLPILAPLDLARAKLRAAGGPTHRRSKRLLDLSDAQALVEDHPSLAAELSDDERRTLETLRP